MPAKPKPPTLCLADFEAFCARLVLDNGKPLELEPFQRELLADVFDPEARECWAVLPEASGKSTLMAAYALFVLMVKPGANVLVASVTMQQAGSAIFRQASDMVASSPGLDRHLRALDSRLTIYGPARSQLRVRPSNARTAQGGIPDVVLIDELGELPSLELARMFRGKLTKRAGAKLFVISTAGEPGGEFETALADIRSSADTALREGRHSRYVTGSARLHEWRLEPSDSITDWKLLKQANPLASVSEEALKDKFESPLTDKVHFRRYTGGIAERDESHIIRRDIWDAAGVDVAPEPGTPCVLGIDYAQSRDMFAAAPLIVAEPMVLAPASVLEPQQQGVPIPRETMIAKIREIDALYPIEQVALDPGSIGSWLADWIRDELNLDVTLAWRNQADAQTATSAFLDALYGGELVHCKDEILTLHALNAVGRYDRDDRFLFARPAAGRTAINQRTRRIDALVAASLAVYLVKLVPLEDEPFALWI